MKNKTKKLLSAFVVSFGLLCGLIYGVQLQIAFVNIGQEFGAYGQYNRVLHVIEEMQEFDIIGSRVGRKLELKHIFHVEEFSVTVKDDYGRSAELVFKKNTVGMKEKDRKKLEAIVLEKFAMTAKKSL